VNMSPCNDLGEVMRTLAEGSVDLGREARRFGVIPEPGDLPPRRGPTLAPRPLLFGPFAGRRGPIHLESLAERLGPVLEK
jgi:hypothetical protein